MIYEYWLAGIEGIPGSKKRKLREVYGDGKTIYYIEETRLEKHTFLNEKDLERLKKAKKDTEIEIKWEKSREKKIKFVPYFSDDYPEKLRVIADPPYALYVLGTLPDKEAKCAAIVGARNCTSYGEQMALQYGKYLAAAGIQVISGMARGIDGAGQRGALNGSGKTFAVLGCGVDVCYPRENMGLYMDIQKNGGIISEFPPGTEPFARNFPMRNRIISGLALGVVAVECARFSGTMKTIEHAMDQDRDIFAVPGNIDAPRSEGPNWLLRQGARPVTCTQDILEEYWLRFPQKLAQSAPLPPEAAQQRLEQLRSRKGPEETGPEEEREEAPAPGGPPEDGAPDLERVPRGEQRSRFTDDQLTLLRAMAGRKKTSTADELVEETQIPARRVLSALTMLQVDGAAREHPGKRFSPLVELEE